jgi:hypothetical protein
MADIRLETDIDEERTLLTRFLALADKEAAASKVVKDAKKALDAKVAAKYPPKFPVTSTPGARGRKSFVRRRKRCRCSAVW